MAPRSTLRRARLDRVPEHASVLVGEGLLGPRLPLALPRVRPHAAPPPAVVSGEMEMTWPTHEPRTTRRVRLTVDLDRYKPKVYDVVHCDRCGSYAEMRGPRDWTGGGVLQWSHSLTRWLCARCFFRP